MAKIKGRQFYDKKTDTIKEKLYVGRRLATDSEVKEYIKSNFDKVNPELLTPEYRAYYGKVKGGRSRSAQSIRIDGKFVSETFEKQLSVTGRGVDFDGLAERLGYSNKKELLMNEPRIYEAAKQLYYGDGLSYTYNSENVFNEIDKYGGKIFINNRAYTKLKAIERLDYLDKLLKRNYGNYITEFDVVFKKGGGEIHFTIPTETEIESGEDLDDFDGINLIESGKTEEQLKKAEERKFKKDKIPEGRFNYEYSALISGRRKSGKLSARTKHEARRMVKELGKKVIVVSLNRKFKNGKG